MGEDTNGLKLGEALCSQASVIKLLVKSFTDLNCSLDSCSIVLARREATAAACSSNRSTLNCFKGATRDFTAINLTFYLSPFVLWRFSCIHTAQTSLKGYLAKLLHLFEHFNPLVTDRRQGVPCPSQLQLAKEPAFLSWPL